MYGNEIGMQKWQRKPALLEQQNIKLPVFSFSYVSKLVSERDVTVQTRHF